MCVGLLSAILLYLVWGEPDPSSDLIIRIIGILSILIAAVTVITPVFHRLSTDDADAEKIDAEIEKLNGRIAELEKKRSASIHYEVAE